jgi:aminopeptidase N
VHGPDHQPIIWTLSEPFGASSWWPCKDDPGDKADSVRLEITVPRGLIAASNGLLIDTLTNTDNTITYIWVTKYPISTYLVSLAISNYIRFDDTYSGGGTDMPLTYFVYPELYTDALQDFGVTVDMIGFFSSVFGEYPFIGEKYGMAVFPWGGGMEHQTLTSYGAALVRGDNRYDYINAHELAHQWFGDLITMRFWSHIWLNEGFASYAEALWYEHLGGKQAYLNYMQSQYRPNFRGSLFVTDSTNSSALFSGTVYDKGSWVLHMLRGVLGDSVFFDCLRTYAADPDLRYGNAVTEDFQAVCETISGKDLAWFFEQWVYREGRPDYSWSWNVSGEGPYYTELAIKQNTTDPYRMPVQIRLQGPGLDTLYTVWNSLRLQSYTFATSAKPTALLFDPENWILKHTETIDIKEVFVSYNYPNPFNQATEIDVYLPAGSDMDFAVFNLLGQVVYQTAGHLEAGYHPIRWNGQDQNTQPVASGLYLARVKVLGKVINRKMMLIR